MSPILDRGIDLAMYGMGTVFVFLTALVLLTMLMSRVLQGTSTATIGADRVPDAETLAVISAAVKQYREKYRA